MADKPARSVADARLAIARGDAAGLADYLMFGKPEKTVMPDGSMTETPHPDPHIIRELALMLSSDLLGSMHVAEMTEGGDFAPVSSSPFRPVQKWRLEFKATRRPGNQPAGTRSTLVRSRMAHLVFDALYPITAGGTPSLAELQAGPAHGALKAAYHTAVEQLASEGMPVALDTVKKAYAEFKNRLLERAIARCK